MSTKLPKFICESIGPIESHLKALEKAEAKGIKKQVIQKTVGKLKLKNLVPKPRPQNGFAVNNDLMLDREPNTNGNLDVRLKVSYQKRPNSIGQVLVPIESYNLANEHPHQKKAVALLLNAVQKGLLKSCADGNVYLVASSNLQEVVAGRTRKGYNPDGSAKKKKVVKRKSARKTNTSSTATEIPSDKILKTIVDPDLGRFKYHDDSYAYICKSVKWCDQKIRFDLSVEEPEETMKRFEDARKVWKAQKRWQKKCMDYATIEMLESANEWLDSQNHKSITSAALKRRIKLMAVDFYDDGDIAFWYDTDNLFYEKGIYVAANVSGEFFEATND